MSVLDTMHSHANSTEAPTVLSGSSDIITSCLPSSTTKLEAEAGPTGVAAVLHSIVWRVVIIAVNATTGILTARALHPSGRGQQAALVLWPTLLSFATTFGLPSAVCYHSKQRDKRLSELFGASLVLGTALSIPAAFMCAQAMPILLRSYPLELINYSRLFLLILPVNALLSIGRAVSESRGDFRTSVTAQWSISLITLLTLLTTWVFGRLNPVSASCAYVISCVPVAVWLMRYLTHVVPPSLERFRDNARLLLSYGIRSYGIELCGTLGGYVDQAFVVNMLTPASMGIYVVALSVSRMLNVCQASVVMVLLPKAAGSSPDRVIALTGRAARASFVLTTIMATTAWLLAPLALRVLYGSGFAEAVPVLRILLIEVSLGGTVWVLAQAPMSLGRPGVVATLQAAGLLLTVPLMFALVPRYSIIGAAIALLISTSARLVLMLVAFPAILRSRTPRLWINLDDIRELCSEVWSIVHPSIVPGKSVSVTV